MIQCVLPPAMKAKYKHTNIIARDWQALSQFYQDIFGCIVIPPERDLSGTWLDDGTGVANAHLRGVHLLLPGHGDKGPTLEILQYANNKPKSATAANREGIMHIAFEVDNIENAVSEIIKHGGSMVGKVTSTNIEGLGMITFVYLADPEGNIIELQSWKKM